MHGNGKECGPSGSSNFNSTEIGHFGCHTLPLVSRSAMKRPLSLSSERERPSSTLRDHYRCRAFRSRSKTIHSDTVGRSYNYKEFNAGQCNLFSSFLDTSYDSRSAIKGHDFYHRKPGKGQINLSGDKNPSLLVMPESTLLEEMSVDEDEDDNSKLSIQEDANSDSSLQSTCNELSSINLFHQYNANQLASTPSKPVLDFNLNPSSALCSSTKFKLNYLLSAREDSTGGNSCMRAIRPFFDDSKYQSEPQLSTRFGHSTNCPPQVTIPLQICDRDSRRLPSPRSNDAKLAIDVYSQLNIKSQPTLDERNNFSNQANSSLNSASTLPKVAPSCAENRSPPLSLTTGSAHIPTEAEKAQFQRSLNSATTLVFHRRSGLPLTSSPAPIRKSGTSFDFDSSLTSVNAIKKALFEKSPDGKDSLYLVRSKLSTSAPTTTSGLLGNFEESVLNGRLEPASIVHGFTAEIGASGSFCPKHKTLPVTVFFYTLQDTDKGEKISSPYLGHINLGNKGYHIPRQGTVQVTLFNPNGTVVKMFVVRYNLSDMPPNSRTFLRQRTLFMPSDANEHNSDSRKWLRYLIHLRFQSSKSGRIRLHTDMRILVFRKHDLDVATLNGGVPYELRSFVQMPSNPKYSKNIKS